MISRLKLHTIIVVGLLLLGACGETAVPTPTPTATATPTLTPTPSPTPEPVTGGVEATPMTSTSLTPGTSPEEILESLLAIFADEAEPFHFEVDAKIDTNVSGLALSIPLRVGGDFQPPDRVRASLSVSLGVISVQNETISIEGRTYTTDPISGEWQVISAAPSLLTSPAALLGMVQPAIESLELVGVESLDGIEVVHIRGDISGGAFGSPSSAARIDVWSSVDDLRVRKVEIDGRVSLADLGEGLPGGITLDSAQLELTLLVSDYGKPVTIEAPEIADEPAGSAGTQLPSLGRNHVLPGDQHPPYNSVPATSGWHFGAPYGPAPWGQYDEVLPDEVLVHSLEHGGIGVHYDCPEGCDELVGDLARVASRYPKFILSPFPGMDRRIALTAWTFFDGFDGFDEGRIVAFFEAHISSPVAPEPNVP